MKDESELKIIDEFVGLKSKIYSMKKWKNKNGNIRNEQFIIIVF